MLFNGWRCARYVSGEHFKVYIFVTDQSFYVALNDEPYCRYAFRCPLATIRTIVVDRDVQSVVRVDHRTVFPTPMPPIAGVDDKLEFSNDIPRRFEPGN